MIFAGCIANAQFIRDTFALKRSPAKDYSKFITRATLPFPPLIPGNFYTENMGFMCKREKYFEKISKIPLRLRIGSINTNDRLEGKRIPITLLP